MFRLTSIFLCALFLAAVAGRYSAEESVSSAQEALAQLELEYADEARRVQVFRAEIAYLEGPERLAKVARATTDLRPPAPEALLSARQFQSAMIGEDAPPPPAPPPFRGEAGGNAIAMVQLADE